MDTTSKASLDCLALSMMSNMYFFQHTDPLYSSFCVIGYARVSAVLINEDSPPQLLIHPVAEEDPVFYSISDLSFSSPVSLTG